MILQNYEREKAAICFQVMHTGGGDTDPRYRALVTDVLDAGLFKRTYFRYALLALAALLGLASSLYLVTVLESVWAQLLNGVWFACWSMQFAMLAHDLSHGEVFVSNRKNHITALFIWSVVAGLSERYWYKKHSSHHDSPNHDGHDPDVDIPFVLDHSQIKNHSPFLIKYLFPYQHILFWVTLPLVYVWIIQTSLSHLITQMNARAFLELLLITAHYIALVSFVFLLATPLSGIAFMAGYFIAGGAYMGIAFAPNHKSEEVIVKDAPYSWVYQISSTRNIFPSRLTSFMLGGLNFQIEHHLFPTMSRYQYFRAQQVVKAFCVREQMTYSETTWLQTMRDIHAILKAVQHA
jgi:fatty acid desaturase